MAPLATAMLLASLLLAACGGSSPASSATAPSSTPSSAPAPTSTPSSATAPSSTPSSATLPSSTTTAASSSTTTAASSGRPPEVSRTKQGHVPHPRPVAPSTGVRIPVSFTIAPGDGRLIPPLISVPRAITIDLSVRNADSRAHAVRFDAPDGYTAEVAAGKTASARISGLPAATYRLLIDGTSRGRVVIGSVPGP